MKTKVTRRGDQWCFRLEATVCVIHYETDSRLDARDVMRSFAEKVEKVFDEGLCTYKAARCGSVKGTLVWDKADPETAGHPWAEPDLRDDFPGYCPHLDCSIGAVNAPGELACEKHRVLEGVWPKIAGEDS